MIANLVKKSIVSLLFACVGIGHAGGELRDRSTSFAVPEGAKYSFGVKLHNAREYHWAASPKSTILSLAGRKWTLSSYQGYDSFTTFSGQSPAEKLAMKSFVFEETPLLWNFSREEIDGRWYNRAYTDTGLDLMAPEGQRKYVSAPKWYTAERLLKKKRAEQEAHNRCRAAILLWTQEEREAKRRAAEGHYHEALWAARESIERIKAEQFEESRDSSGAVTHYCEKALDCAKGVGAFAADVLIPGGLENQLLYFRGEIGVGEYISNIAIDAGITCASLGFKVGKAAVKAVKAIDKAALNIKPLQPVAEQIVSEAKKLAGSKKFAEFLTRADKPSAVNKIATPGKSGGKNPLKIQKNQPKTEKVKPENLQKEQAGKVAKYDFTQLPPTTIHKHHIFPQKFKPFFDKKGINIDEHCVDLGVATHLKGIHGKGNMGIAPGRWNTKWRDFIEQNPNASQKEIYQFGGKLLDEFKIGHLPIGKYKK